MQENEKKKPGFFGKLKNILFVDDDDHGEELPDYTEPKEENEKVIVHENPEEEKVIPSRFDIEKPIDDVIMEPNKIEQVDEIVTEHEEIKIEGPEEKPSPFLSFDEDEFKNFTSRVARNEARVREETKPEYTVKERLTYNLPNTGKSAMSSVGNTGTSKKPFTPSPVMSPVYGILDKNYSKEDIIDKRTDRRQIKFDSVDRVRRKALGEEEKPMVKKIDIETTIEEDLEPLPKTKPVIEEEPVIKKEEHHIEVKEEKREPKILSREEKNNNIVKEMPRPLKPRREEIEDIEEEKVVSPIESELNEMIDNYTDIDEDLVQEELPKKSNKLDDLEKTSTLKILDDIEKELNSIKPSDDGEPEEKEEKSNQILEKDIFNMISSMYVGGDEEDDSD